MLLKGRVAVVTGGASGIGQAIARLFAAEGARLAILDLAEPRLEMVEELRAGSTSEPLFLTVDVRSAEAVARAIDEVAQTTARIDVLVNCAGVREIASSLDLPTSDWDNVIATNLSGMFYCSQAAARTMTESGGGSIINLSSIAGLLAVPNRPAYTAAKHGVLGMTKAMAADLAPFKIRVNAICAGLVRTPFTESFFTDEEFVAGLPRAIPLGTYAEPSDIAQPALFLASEMSRHITGASLAVDGGFSAVKTYDTTGKAETPFAPMRPTIGE